MKGKSKKEKGKNGKAALLGLLVFLLVSAEVFAQSKPTAHVSVRAEAIAVGDSVTLGDVAEVKASTQSVAERLRAVSLGFAPKVGAVRELSREAIERAIAAAGFSGAQVAITFPHVALVRRASQTVDLSLVREAVEHAVLTELRVAGATARLTRLDFPSQIELASGTVEARAKRPVGVRNLFEPFPISIELLVDGRVAVRASATVQVEAFAPVLLATHDVMAGARLREADATVEIRRLTQHHARYISDSARLRGASTTRAFASGEPLLTDGLAAAIVIRTGDRVRINGLSGQTQISVEGEARAAGRVGERILVKNMASGILLQAVVEDEGLVSVRF